MKAKIPSMIATFECMIDLVDSVGKLAKRKLESPRFVLN